LTGISISEGKAKVPKSFKREVRSRAYELVAYGLAAFRDGESFDPFAYDRVLGKLLFWRYVEPDAQFPRRYIEHLRNRFGGGRLS
jgi:hypothetical protein